MFFVFVVTLLAVGFIITGSVLIWEKLAQLCKNTTDSWKDQYVAISLSVLAFLSVLSIFVVLVAILLGSIPNWCIDLFRDEHLHSSFIAFNKFYLEYSINYELYADADIEVWWSLYPEHYKEDIQKAKYGIYE